MALFMYKMWRQIFANIKNVREYRLSMYSKPNTPVGRWNIKDDYELKSYLANIDNCGDRLCGTPKYISNKLLNHNKTLNNYKLPSCNVMNEISIYEDPDDESVPL